MSESNADKLRALLAEKSEDFRAGFFAAVNFNSEIKAAFLRNFIGEKVQVIEINDVSN